MPFRILKSKSSEEFVTSNNMRNQYAQICFRILSQHILKDPSTLWYLKSPESVQKKLLYEILELGPRFGRWTCHHRRSTTTVFLRRQDFPCKHRNNKHMDGYPMNHHTERFRQSSPSKTVYKVSLCFCILDCLRTTFPRSTPLMDNTSKNKMIFSDISRCQLYIEC